MKIITILALFFSVINLTAQNMHETCPLTEGVKFPSYVMLTTASGTLESLEDIVDDTPSILIFYRGGW